MKQNKKVTFTERNLLDMYGLMFKMGYLDGGLDKDELKKLFEVINLTNFSITGKKQINEWLICVPDISLMIQRLSKEEREIKFASYMNVIAIYISNDDDTCCEQILFIDEIQKKFDITDEQRKEILKFARKAKEIGDRGIDDKYAEDALKTAFAGLAGVGVPLAGVYFSGSVIGLSAAGITSGLANIFGLAGIGMVPGIGVAILVGAAIFTVLTLSLDVGGKRKKAKYKENKIRQAEAVIKNLQDAINYMIDKLNELDKKASDAEATKEALEKYKEVLKNLRNIQKAKTEGMDSNE
jgi:FtsZ-binding cell division protein ZapB